MTRREEILDEAARLVARRGFHGVSIAGPGPACGISGAALRQHFARKTTIPPQLREAAADGATPWAG